MRKGVVWTFIIFSFLGFLDSSYLALNHYLNRVPPCNFLTGCEQVTTSEYAVIFGVPVALLGVTYYFAFFLLAIFAFQSRKSSVLTFLSWASWAGFVFSAYLVYLQVAVIGYLCMYCVLSALISTGLFVTGLLNLRRPLP